MRHYAGPDAVLHEARDTGRLDGDVMEAGLGRFVEVDFQGRVGGSQRHLVLLQTYIKIIVCSMNNFNF